jgi:hypothetical protein
VPFHVAVKEHLMPLCVSWSAPGFRLPSCRKETPLSRRKLAGCGCCFLVEQHVVGTGEVRWVLVLSASEVVFQIAPEGSVAPLIGSSHEAGGYSL